MKHTLYIYIVCLLTFASCQHDEMGVFEGHGQLCLELYRAGLPKMATRSADSDLAVTILDSHGNVLEQYAAGEVPAKIVLEVGQFTVRAYTDNQSSWKTQNGGKGAGCYYADTLITMQPDAQLNLVMEVPMTNYAATLRLPETFGTLFSSYTFTLASGGRQVTVTEGEKAYFDVADGGFTYSLRATNTDGNTHSHSAILFPEVESGKLFTVHYDYASAATTGGVDIEITDNMETDDNDIKI